MDVIRGLFILITIVLRWFFIVLLWVLRRLFRLSRRNRRKGGAHGSARWATRWEQWRNGAISGDGVVLGRGAFGRLLRFSTDGLVMVFAATGAGKGIGVVIPSLLTYRGSMVVTDPKGENYAVTRRHRVQFGNVRMLNPSDLLHSERYNPMGIIRAGTSHEADDGGALAQLMIKPDKDGNHWDDKATSLLKALILHTMQEPPASRTLATVRRLSVGGQETFIDTLQQIAGNSTSLAAAEIAAGFLSSSKGNDGGFSPEFASILSNLQKATEPWSAGSPAGTLASSSTFDLTELTTGTTTLYLCVDEDLLDVYSPWLRVMVGCILKTLTRAKAAPSKRKVVLLLDEVAVLGPLDQLQKQSGLLRAYCTPVLIWQSLPQVFSVYGEAAKAFMANASARVFFGVNDNDTAQYVATMVGQTTTLTSSSGSSRSADAWLNHNRQEGKSESGYWLLDASEVQRLPLTRTVIKLRNVPFSILGRRIDYRRMRRWRGRWDRWNGARPKGFTSEPTQSPENTAISLSVPSTNTEFPDSTSH